MSAWMGIPREWMFEPAPGSARGVFPAPAAPRGPSLWLARLADDRRELARFWPVVQNMVVQELRVRYQRSILGFVWTLLNPILMMVTLSWVFSHIIRDVAELSALSLRRHGALELPEHQPERNARSGSFRTRA